MAPPSSVPRFSRDQVERLAKDHYRLAGTLDPLPSYADQNLRLTGPDGRRWVIKLAHAGASEALVNAQLDALDTLAACATAAAVPTVRRAGDGRRLVEVEGTGDRRHLLYVLSYLDGRPLGAGRHHPALLASVGRLVATVGQGLEGFSRQVLRRSAYIWDLRHAGIALPECHRIAPTRRRLLAEHNLERFARQVAPRIDALPRAVIHSDANEQNVLVGERDGEPVATGLIDFGDLVDSCRVFDPAIAAAYACLGHDQPLEAIAAVVAGYHAIQPLTSVERDVLFPSLLARLAVSVTMSAKSRHERPENTYANVSEAAAWHAMERLAGVGDEVARRRVGEACGEVDDDSGSTPGASARPARGRDALLARRARHLGRNLSVAYDEPLEIVGGHMQYLFDSAGRPYVDGVNNVCHVGHSHPRVVRAIARQAARLNTNTRYLHENLVAYAERLTATLPDPLEVCFFVCTGSEANDLALRLARAATGRHGVVTLEGAYHGHTGCLIEISPYKHDGPGGRGAPAHVRTVPMPDAYRLRLVDEPRAGEMLARPVAEALDELAATEHAGSERGAAAFIAESLLGCGGQVVPADGYMPRAFAHARAAGAVCIIDEVQVGFGRVGTHFWAFEALGVVPDIVTMGKPIGNGHPLAAVVTTRAIADAFANGMEYFNTFGGNPVSCAAGLAVLDVIEDEDLQAHTLAVGNDLQRELAQLAARHELIGDVRGRGLFLGVELVRDRATLEPAAEEAARIVEELRRRGILLSTDGPLHNVLKIKPPLPFAPENATHLVEELDRALGLTMAPATLRP